MNQSQSPAKAVKKRKRTSESKEVTPPLQQQQQVSCFAAPAASKRAKKDSVKRVIQSRKKGADRKPYYDEKDKEALKLMRKLRVDLNDSLSSS